MRNKVFKDGIVISDSGWLRKDQENKIIKEANEYLQKELSKTDHHALKKAEGVSYDQTVLDERQAMRDSLNALEINIKKESVLEKDMDMINVEDPNSWIAFNNKYS